MLSATGITATLAILALAANVSVTDTAPAPPAPGDGTALVVNADGSAAFSTLTDAVAAAASGDTILVEPGSYTEAIVIDKDLTLRGDGPREDIVLRAPEDGPTWSVQSSGGRTHDEHYVIALDGSDATIEGLTLTGQNASIVIHGGAPTVSGLMFDGVAIPYEGGGANDYSGNAISIDSGSTAQILDNSLVGGPIGVFGGSEPTIANNHLTGGGHIWGQFGDGASVVGNEIDGTLVAAINLLTATGMLIEGNTITGTVGSGISGGHYAPGTQPRVVGNVISGVSTGIYMGEGSAPTIEGNDVSGTSIAISLNESDAAVRDNTIYETWNGISLFRGGDALIEGNDIDADGHAIQIGSEAVAAVTRNDVCGGVASISVNATATAELTDNTTCEAT
jgi:parallel beta-helix repeat protein